MLIPFIPVLSTFKKKLVMPYNERIGDAAQRTLNENPQNINNIWLESENSEVEIKAVFKNQLSVISWLYSHSLHSGSFSDRKSKIASLPRKDESRNLLEIPGLNLGTWKCKNWKKVQKKSPENGLWN